MARTNNRGRSGKNTVQNVRVLDEYAGQDGARIERMLGSLQNSHSQIRVLCSSPILLVTTTAGYVSSSSGASIRLSDDFVSIAQQFETYRITAIQYDVYDINTGNVATGFFSTWHDNVANGAIASFTEGNVIDAPDSQLVPPGTGKISLSWVAKGTLENTFQATANQGENPRDFGGLRYSISGGSDAVTKYRVILKAIVDFRGRF